MSAKKQKESDRSQKKFVKDYNSGEGAWDNSKEGTAPSVADKIKKFGSAPRIQLNDQFAEVSDIRAFIESERAAKNEVDIPFLTTTIKCDKDVKMGDVSDIKQELRQVGALRIMYAASRRTKDTY